MVQVQMGGRWEERREVNWCVLVFWFFVCVPVFVFVFTFLFFRFLLRVFLFSCLVCCGCELRNWLAFSMRN